MSLALRSGYVLAGIGLAGVSLLAACTPSPESPSAEALAACHRAIQRATLSLQVAGDDLPVTDRQAAHSQLQDARNRVLHVWAAREGLDIPETGFARQSAKAEAFVNGINAEAGLSEQDRLTTLSEAADESSAWRTRLDAALDCADRVAP
ncbi:hypothetical protein [Henriciella aquimarina]|uniref:hypothetical protein n=1 Tax=Henriciella aquimarina TaxID=545261 RepID=UPI0009FC1029|nr:hypothetical protein [Henriciella aquimarina]